MSDPENHTPRLSNNQSDETDSDSAASVVEEAAPPNATVHDLKFDRKPRQTIERAHDSESLGATVRYNDERGIEAGDVLTLCSTTGDSFGSAVVEAVRQVPAYQALGIIQSYDACYGIDNGMRLISELNNYYGGATHTIYPETDVKILMYRVVELTDRLDSSCATPRNEVSFSDPDPPLRDDRPHCKQCGEVIENEDWLIEITEGKWAGTGFDSHPIEEAWCEDCHRTHRKREAAAYFDVDDSEQLWDILSAADGDLAADFSPISTTGGYVRIVDGDLQVLSITRQFDTKQKIVSFEAEPVTWTEEIFHDRIAKAQSAAADDSPTILLKPTTETPFAEWVSLPDDKQTTLEIDYDQPES